MDDEEMEQRIEAECDFIDCQIDKNAKIKNQLGGGPLLQKSVEAKREEEQGRKAQEHEKILARKRKIEGTKQRKLQQAQELKQVQELKQAQLVRKVNQLNITEVQPPASLNSTKLIADPIDDWEALYQDHE
jgi:hypothetical protein